MHAANRRTEADAGYTRPGLAPGLLGCLALLAGLALLGTDGFIFIRFGVSILALILCVFIIRARAWWWLLASVPIAVLWNPVLEFDLHGQGWVSAQLIGALLFVAMGVRIKVPTEQ